MSTARRTKGRTTNGSREDRAGDGGSPEEAKARAWLKAHSNDPLVAGASLPSDHRRDPETGETIDTARSAWLSGHGRAEAGVSNEGSSRIGLVSYSKWPTNQKWEETMTGPDGSRTYEPVVGRGGLTPEQLDKRIRMERAFGQLPEQRQQVLRLRFFEQLSIQELAEELGIKKASARDRINVAVQDLYKAIGETWNEDYDLLREVFG